MGMAESQNYRMADYRMAGCELHGRVVLQSCDSTILQSCNPTILQSCNPAILQFKETE